MEQSQRTIYKIKILKEIKSEINYKDKIMGKGVGLRN